MKRLLAVAIVAVFLALPATVPADEARPAGPADKEAARAERLDRLFADLAAATTEKGAKSIAERIAKTFLVSNSATVDLLMHRALKATRDKNYALSLDLLDAVIRLKPDFVEGWNKRATVHFMRKDYARSLADIYETLRREPRHFGAITGLAVILGRLDQDDRAHAAYRRLLEIYPHNRTAREAIERLAGAGGRDI